MAIIGNEDYEKRKAIEEANKESYWKVVRMTQSDYPVSEYEAVSDYEYDIRRVAWCSDHMGVSGVLYCIFIFIIWPVIIYGMGDITGHHTDLIALVLVIICWGSYFWFMTRYADKIWDKWNNYQWKIACRKKMRAGK